MSRARKAEKAAAEKELDRRIWEFIDTKTRREQIELQLNISPKRYTEALSRGRPADMSPPQERDWEQLTADCKFRPEKRLRIPYKRAERTALDELRRESGRPRAPMHVVMSDRKRTKSPPLQPTTPQASSSVAISASGKPRISQGGMVGSLKRKLAHP